MIHKNKYYFIFIGLYIGSLIFITVLSTGNIFNKNLCSIVVTNTVKNTKKIAAHSCLNTQADFSLTSNNLIAYYTDYSYFRDAELLVKLRLKVSPEDQLARFYLGKLLWDQEDKSKAIDQWRAVPNADVYFANQSISALKQNELYTAEEYAEISQMINWKDSVERQSMYQELCKAWFIEGFSEKAKHWCEKSAWMLPNGWTQIQLADVQMDLGYTEDALVSLQWGLEVGSKESQGQINQKIGQLYAQLGQPKRSIVYFHTALQMGLSNKWLHHGLARALLDFGDFEEACNHYLIAVDLGHVPSAYDIRVFGDCSLKR